MELQVHCPEVQRLNLDSDDNRPITSQDSFDDDETPIKLQQSPSTNTLLSNSQKQVSIPYIDKESPSMEDETEFSIVSGQRSFKSDNTPPAIKLDDCSLMAAKNLCEGNANIDASERRRNAMFKPIVGFNERTYSSS